jgi:hypothetical protein
MEPETATTPPPETQAPITAMEDVCTTPPASGASAVSADLYEPTCTWLDNRVKRIVNTACILATGAGLKTVQPQHIEQALVEEKLQVLN